MALTLGRKPGEKLFILDELGREIEIEVVKGNGAIANQLKLRVTAPQEFKIVRGEIHDNNSK